MLKLAKEAGSFSNTSLYRLVKAEFQREGPVRINTELTMIKINMNRMARASRENLIGSFMCNCRLIRVPLAAPMLFFCIP
jgi:hypothetical protein